MAPVARLLEISTRRRGAVIVLLIAAALGAGGLVVGRNIKVGDLDPGAPELRANSRYNTDNAYITGHYGLSTDEFAVIVKSSKPSGIASYETMIEMDRLERMLQKVPGVQATVSAASRMRRYTAGGFDGNPKWMTINRDHYVVANAINGSRADYAEIANTEYTVAPVIVYLNDHKAETLARVVEAVKSFAAAHDTADRHFLLAAGSAGIEAATNIVVEGANDRMLMLVYAAVTILCIFSFRSWRGALVAIIPLALTSVLCQALMVVLGIGIKVATLPVIALGVGIGVDYALYILSTQLTAQRLGCSVHVAYASALRFTGKMVGLVGVTLGTGVTVWAASPIKFQADMGILLTFMFLWNMVGALFLIPALSHFLLGSVSTKAAAAQKTPLGAAAGSSCS